MFRLNYLRWFFICHQSASGRILCKETTSQLMIRSHCFEEERKFTEMVTIWNVNNKTRK